MARDSVVKNFKVERTIDHGMLEGRGTENPNWIRDEVAEGHRQIKIREIKDSAVTMRRTPRDSPTKTSIRCGAMTAS